MYPLLYDDFFLDQPAEEFNRDHHEPEADLEPQEPPSDPRPPEDVATERAKRNGFESLAHLCYYYGIGLQQALHLLNV